MSKLLLVKVLFACLVCFVLFSPVQGLCCEGEFMLDFPRKIELVPVAGAAAGYARLLAYEGEAWLIPAPSGLFDLENLTNKTLPHNEDFKAQAFVLAKGRVCFTNYNGVGGWPDERAPVVATVTIEAPRPRAVAGALHSSLTAGTLKELAAYLAGEKETLAAAVGVEVQERVHMRFSLLQAIGAHDASKYLGIETALHHGKALSDIVQLRMEFEARGHHITLFYAVPYATLDELGPAIKKLEKAVDAWTADFCRLNSIPLPAVTLGAASH